jgi:hypothetical protein
LRNRRLLNRADEAILRWRKQNAYGAAFAEPQLAVTSNANP